MSDTTPNPDEKNPGTGASATTPEHREPADIDYDAAATDRIERNTPEESENFTGTGSHAAVPAPAEASLADDYAAPESYRSGTPSIVPAPVPAPAAPAADAPGAPDQAATATPPQATATAQQTPIYVQAPAPPRDKGNRGAGLLIALLSTALYAALYAIVTFIFAGLSSNTFAGAALKFAEFAVRPVFYVPIIFFFLAFALLIALVNRGGWWAYVLFGFLVAVVVYFSYIGGVLLTVQAWTLTPAEAARFLSGQWFTPGAIAAAVIAREVPIWTGAWIAGRGRRVAARNTEARQEYERLLAEGPQISRSA